MALNANTTIAKLVDSKEFATLDSNGLRVLLVLVAQRGKQGRLMEIGNTQFGLHPATVRNALRRLQAMGMVEVTYDSPQRRTLRML